MASAVPAVYTQLVTLVQAEIDTRGDVVTVLSAPRPLEQIVGGEHLMFGDAQVQSEYGTLGGEREEEISVQVFCFGTAVGNTDADATSARDAAYDVFDVLEDVLDDDSTLNDLAGTEGLRYLNAEVTEHRLTQGITDNGRWAQIEAEVTIMARVQGTI